MAYYTRQITFKVSQAIATQLGQLGASRDLSPNLMAKELVVDALNRTGLDALPRLEPKTNGHALNGESHPACRPTEPCHAESMVVPAAASITTHSVLPGEGIAMIRRDIKKLATAFFCQSGLGIEAARERTNIIFGTTDE